MGCLRSLGCLTLLIIVGALGWFFRDDVMRYVNRERGVAEAPAEGRWEALTPQGAERARASVSRLERRSGQVYENVRPGDISAYVFQELAKQALPPSTDSAEAAVIGNQLHVRGVMKLSDFGGPGALGPLGAMLGDRAHVEFGGTIDVVRSGLAQYRLKMIRVGEQEIPPPLIPKLVQRIDRSARPAGIAPEALPLMVPDYVGDVRIGGGKVTLIKGTR